MLQLGGETNFALEAFTAERRRELRVQHLDRDFAIVPNVVREVDDGHTAATKLAEHFVLTRERLFQARKNVSRFRLFVERIGQGGNGLGGRNAPISSGRARATSSYGA